MSPSVHHLTAMLDLHHQRMVGRLRNIMDSLTRRVCTTGTITDEMVFLSLEVEAYRAFMHRHAEALIPGAADVDAARAEADSLYFEVLQLARLMEGEEARDSALMARLSRLGGTLLAQAQRGHQHAVQARNDRLAMLRDLVRQARLRSEPWPPDPASDGVVAIGNNGYQSVRRA